MKWFSLYDEFKFQVQITYIFLIKSLNITLSKLETYLQKWVTNTNLIIAFSCG